CIDLLDEGVFHSYLRDPRRVGHELRRHKRGAWVVVDEIQRLPALLNEVHRAIEDLGLRFVLLGSSARKLKVAGTNLLAGRAVRREMHPLQPDEMGADFDLKEVLRYGSVPIIWRAPHKPDRLDAYAQLYLREEIQAEALVRNLPGFARFLPIAALVHGQVVNTAGIAREAGVARTTVSGYLDILQDTYLVTLLPPYEAKLYWAPAQGGTEVDFLLRRGKSFVAVEVKTTTNPAPRDFAGLRAIADLKGVKRRVLVHMGERAFNTPEGIEALPVMQFATEVVAGKV
ncbi:MAG: hypothetical protein HW394_1708, partial [Acidobacteria bacterium]|nr:hypothetical protein [Acidobacteriota bacterium]